MAVVSRSSSSTLQLEFFIAEFTHLFLAFLPCMQSPLGDNLRNQRELELGGGLRGKDHGCETTSQRDAFGQSRGPVSDIGIELERS